MGRDVAVNENTHANACGLFSTTLFIRNLLDVMKRHIYDVVDIHRQKICNHEYEKGKNNFEPMNFLSTRANHTFHQSIDYICGVQDLFLSKVEGDPIGGALHDRL
jgi:hypothetical protein